MRILPMIVAAALLLPGVALAQKAGTTRDQMLSRTEARFRNFDADKDGRLTKEELKNGVAGRAGTHAKTGPKAMKRLMRRDDADQDGIITLDEFKAAATERFARLDADGNGTIDADEVH